MYYFQCFGEAEAKTGLLQIYWGTYTWRKRVESCRRQGGPLDRWRSVMWRQQGGNYSGVPRKFQPVRWGVLMPKSAIRSSRAGCSKGPAWIPPTVLSHGKHDISVSGLVGPGAAAAGSASPGCSPQQETWVFSSWLPQCAWWLSDRDKPPSREILSALTNNLTIGNNR